MNKGVSPLGDALPPELLIAVLAVNMAEDPSYVLTALAVSRQWRATCLSAPSLWRHCTLTNEKALEKLAMWTEQSADDEDRKGVVHLTIKKGVPSDILWELLETWRLSTRVRKAQRIVKNDLIPLSLSVTLGSARSISTLFLWLSHRPLPWGLHSLIIETNQSEGTQATNHIQLISAISAGSSQRQADSSERLHQGLPLEHLALNTFGFVQVRTWPYTLLRSLHMHNVLGELVPNHLVKLLSQCPHIESLIIDSVANPGRSNGGPTATMPALRYLELGSWKRAAYFLSHLEAPKLETISLRQIPGVSTALYGWIFPDSDSSEPRIPGALRTLLLKSCGIDVPRLAEVVRLCVNLEILSIYDTGQVLSPMMETLAKHPCLQILRFALCSKLEWQSLRGLDVKMWESNGGESKVEGTTVVKTEDEEIVNRDVFLFENMSPESWKKVEDALARGDPLVHGKGRMLIIKGQLMQGWDKKSVVVLERVGWHLVNEPLI